MTMTEPNERRIYRERCKHNLTGLCLDKSGWDANGFHYNMACTGRCDRMRRYDHEHGLQGEKIQVTQD